MKHFLLAAWVIASQLFASNAALGDDGFVGIYADAQGTLPCTTVPQGSGTTLYLLAKVAGATASGITGAEFRIEVSNPTGWFFSYAPPTSGTTVLGQALDLEPGNPDDPQVSTSHSRAAAHQQPAASRLGRSASTT